MYVVFESLSYFITKKKNKKIARTLECYDTGTEREWQDFLEMCRLRSRLEGTECVATWRGSPRIYVDVIINNTVVSSIDVCQIQSVYNAERDYLKSIDRVEDRMCCVRGDLTMIVADPSWSLYRVMYCPSMKDEGEFDGQYVAQQVGVSLCVSLSRISMVDIL